MREVQQISVQIGAVAGRSGECLARWSSQFYGATYAVHFPDSILGAPWSSLPQRQTRSCRHGTPDPSLSTSTAPVRIRGVPQSIPNKVEAEHGRDDEDGRNEEPRPVDENVYLLRGGEERTPTHSR